MHSLPLFLFAAVAEKQDGHGREFIFVPLPNHSPPYDNIGVIIQAVTTLTTHVDVTVPLRSLKYNLTLSSGSGPRNLSLPNSLLSRNADVIDTTILITSDHDISVVAYNNNKDTADAYTVVPTHQLGHEYIVATYTSSLAAIIVISAWKEGVEVEIFPTSSVQFKGVTYSPGNAIRQYLRPFESLQLLPTSKDITGTQVFASNPVVVSVGSLCSNVPSTVLACDHLSEQLIPITRWGTSFTLSPFVGRDSGYLFQVVSARNNTRVRLIITNSHDIIIRLSVGEFYEASVASQDMTFVTSNKPILIMQYLKGSKADSKLSDPSMIRVIPTERYVSTAIFPVMDSWNVNLNVTSLAITSECDDFDFLSVFRGTNRIQVKE